MDAMTATATETRFIIASSESQARRLYREKQDLRLTWEQAVGALSIMQTRSPGMFEGYSIWECVEERLEMRRVGNAA
jgi:hypothetical protein